MRQARNNSVDEGVVAFGRWICKNTPLSITLKQFSGRNIILHDNSGDVTVQVAEGIPSCLHCRSGDCIHVGLAVCAGQMRGMLGAL